jgi:calcineurin-like phosphoesterase family protein
MSKRFFTSEHWGHPNIIKYEPEYRVNPKTGTIFRSVQEMDAALLDAWNNTVCPEDSV